MKYIVLLICSLCLCSCTRLNIDDSVSAEVKSKIRSWSRSGTCTNASASEYYFVNQTVYVLDPGTCGADMQALVIDVDANTLGTLGGIAGETRVQNINFDSAAVFVKTVWKK